MLFVDDDQSQLRRRGEDRAPRADHDLHAACGNLLPVPVPLGVGQMAMQDGDRIESATESANRLRRKTDLGDQHDRLPTIADHLANRLDINFRLAASSHAMQQHRAMLPRALQTQNRVERLLLIGIELQVLFARGRFGRWDTLRLSLANCTDQAFLSQRGQGGRPAIGGLRQFGGVHRPSGGRQDFQYDLLLRGQFESYGIRRLPIRADERRDESRAGLLLDSRGHHRFEDLAPTAQVIVGDPPREAQHVGRHERLTIENRFNRFEPLLLARRGQRHAVADRRSIAFPERRLHSLAGGNYRPQAVGNEIIERRIDRPIEHQPRNQSIILGGNFPRQRFGGKARGDNTPAVVFFATVLPVPFRTILSIAHGFCRNRSAIESRICRKAS